MLRVGIFMNFEWDENKRRSNIEKHGLDFRDAPRLFDEDYVEVKTRAGSGGEERFLATGIVNEKYVTVIHTERDGATRIISFRKARKNEHRRYQAVHGR